ncbi:MAG: hypothetical protein HYY23_19115 [Verrucomicrobia bacterium]|nr:hypothetical protein [Verrucomicrobiota bacterium]
MKRTQKTSLGAAALLLALTIKFIIAAEQASVLLAPAAKIMSPSDGAQLTALTDLEIKVQVLDTDGWIQQVELMANDRKIGEVKIEFGQAPPPGDTRTFIFHFWGETPGPYTLVAKVTDNAGNTAISSQVRVSLAEKPPEPPPQRPPEIKLTQPLEGASFRSPADVGITAETRDPDGLVELVEFMAGETKIGEAKRQATQVPSSGETQLFSFNWTKVFAGPYKLVARATDNSGNTAWSAQVEILVENVPTSPVNRPPMANIVSPSDRGTFTAPATIEIKTEAIDTDGWVTQVEFLANEAKIGEAKLESAQPPVAQAQTFSFKWTNVVAGQYSLTVRATDQTGTSSRSNPIQISVTPIRDNNPAPPPPSAAPPGAGPVVTIQTQDGHAAEANGKSGKVNPAAFKVRRAGDSNSELKIYYSLSGTASNGVDYLMLPGSLTIPRGEKSALIKLTPMDDKLSEPTETVVLKLESAPGVSPNTAAASYVIGPRDKAVVTLDDNDSRGRSSGRLNDGHFLFCLPGMKGQKIRVEVSDDLVTWEVVESKTVTEDDLNFVDSESPGRGHRYYRVVRAPNDSDDD